jgi:hypothetical protein
MLIPYRISATKLNALDSQNSSSDDNIGPSEDPGEEQNNTDGSMNENIAKMKKKFMKRITRLEDIVSRQEIEIYKLRKTCTELKEVSQAFTQLLQLLREAGLDAETLSSSESRGSSAKTSDRNQRIKMAKESNSDATDDDSKGESLSSSRRRIVESYDDEVIFGTAPSSVIDAADAAGAAILAAMLGGKQRMLVDVRDAELSTDPETLVQFIELAILPIAAGLEGLKSTRNRVKIVFPKVSQLLEYRRTMALAAPEVVALSTLSFDPVEKKDKLVVIVAPEPDDEEGIHALRNLLMPSEAGMEPIQQPIVLLNYHMIPFSGVDIEFETAYHLRLLRVQYMSNGVAQKYMEDFMENDPSDVSTDEQENQGIELGIEPKTSDEALEKAMRHAHEAGLHEGVTRAMVIRAYPRPWHVFVDLSPESDSDFEVAATFDEEPSLEQVHSSIVECLEGSEIEDEIVAQQMQQALEDGQLNNISDMISKALDRYGERNDDDQDSSDDDDDDFDMFEEDSV